MKNIQNRVARIFLITTNKISINPSPNSNISHNTDLHFTTLIYPTLEAVIKCFGNRQPNNNIKTFFFPNTSKPMVILHVRKTVNTTQSIPFFNGIMAYVR